MPTINKGGNPRSRDTSFNEIKKWSRKAHFLENNNKKRVPDPIKGIRQIQLQDESLFVPGMARVDCFLNKENGV